MATAPQHALNAYAKVGIETGLEAADPHRLILMLFDGAMLATLDAKRHMASGNLAGKGESISKAIMIIEDGLRASLDLRVGGALAQNLRALYSYMSQRLLMASVRKDPAMMDEVHKLLVELRDAWAAIEPGASAPAASAAARRS
ncbi:MAG TPA: flagellar export chaperone FliS [Burkholderiales bacterium]|nr:flagellar export chaperone FliS [Burkholderiales bacterium]